MTSKYQIWYDQIVTRAFGRKLDYYSERHHILPKSLGGGNEESNLVDLTYREHFLVHWLLTKIYDGDARRPMVFALHCMTMSVHGRLIAGWQIEAAKRAIKDEVRRTAVIRRARWHMARNLALSLAKSDKEMAEQPLRKYDPAKGGDRNCLRKMATDLLQDRVSKIRKVPLHGRGKGILRHRGQRKVVPGKLPERPFRMKSSAKRREALKKLFEEC